MKFPSLVLLLFVFLTCQKRETQSFDLVILNASLVEVEEGLIIEGQFVGINQDTIAQIGDMAELKQISDGTKTLDAKGNFVMPGLWDMHVHFRGGEQLAQENKDLLQMFLQFGVTTVRDAGGDLNTQVLDWKNKIIEGKMQGPQIFTSGPKLDGQGPAWPGSLNVMDSISAVKALDSLEILGVDYVKTYDGDLSSSAFYSIISEAQTRGLKVTGHMPLSADFEKAIALGLDGTEHLYYVLKSCAPIADSLSELGMGYNVFGPLLDAYDPAMAQKVFEKMASNNVTVTPTFYISKTLSELLSTDHSQDSLLENIGPGIIATYQGRIERAKKSQSQGNNRYTKMNAVSKQMLKPMYEAGVPILAGSDAGPFNSYVYPGASLHGELALMVQKGLSPQQALSTSIINGPTFFGLEDIYCSIKQGRKADLIVLLKNPLEQIENTTSIQWVVKNGVVN